MSADKTNELRFFLSRHAVIVSMRTNFIVILSPPIKTVKRSYIIFMTILQDLKYRAYMGNAVSRDYSAMLILLCRTKKRSLTKLNKTY